MDEDSAGDYVDQHGAHAAHGVCPRGSRHPERQQQVDRRAEQNQAAEDDPDHSGGMNCSRVLGITGRQFLLFTDVFSHGAPPVKSNGD
jgi:hypothetical protein